MEAAAPSEMSLQINHTTRRHCAEDAESHQHVSNSIRHHKLQTLPPFFLQLTNQTTIKSHNR